jgi:hypothetical protein
LRVQRTPATVFLIAIPLIRHFSPAGANIMCLNYIAATENTLADPTAATKFAVSLTTAEEFLQGKHSMAAVR